MPAMAIMVERNNQVGPLADEASGLFWLATSIEGDWAETKDTPVGIDSGHVAISR